MVNHAMGVTRSLPGMQRADGRYTIGAVAKATAILDCFGRRQEWSLTELSEALRMHKSTLFRLVSTLAASGYLERNEATGLYRLGPKFATLESVLARQEPIHWVSLAPLQDLAAACGETAHVAVLYEGWAVTVQVVEGPAAVRMRSCVGKRRPAHCSALGKVLLAHRDEGEVEAYIRQPGLVARTPHTITNAREFRRHLRQVRAQGYAVDNEELEEGLRCVAAPIALPGGPVAAAVSISGPAWRLTPERVPQTVPLVQQAARRIAEGLTAFGWGSPRRG